MRGGLNELRRTFRAGGTAEILAAAHRIPGIFVITQNGSDGITDGFGRVFFQMNTGAHFRGTPCHRPLLVGLGEQHHGGGHVQAFGDAVHSAVGQKHAGPGEHLQLIHIGLHRDIFRQVLKLLLIHSFSTGDQHLHRLIGQGFYALMVEVGAVVDDGAQRDIHQGLALLVWLPLRKHRGADEGIVL